MKKILLSLLGMFSTVSVFAQSVESEALVESTFSTEKFSLEGQHLTFKGIPINGTPEEFGRRLEEYGFVREEIDENMYWYKGGSFAGYDNCVVIVKSYNNLVYEVAVNLPMRYTWRYLYNDYSSLVASLTRKYGDPYYQEEKFINIPSYVDIEDDNDKYSEVIAGHCRYYASFNIEDGWIGRIVIAIKEVGCVGIHYVDSYNEAIMIQTVENEL